MRPVTDLERRVAPFKVVSDYQPSGDQPTAIKEITKRIDGGVQDVVLLGATGTGKTATVAWVAEQVQRPMLVLQPNKTLAAQFANELRQLFPDNAVEYFVSYYDYYQPEAYVPQTDTYIEKDSSINEEVERLRHSATNSLLTRRDVIVVSTVSCIYGLGTPQEYVDRMLRLRVGEERDRDSILRQLVEIQYTRNDMSFTRGTFRVRGDTLEIFPVYEEHAVRIEFFGDEIERLMSLHAVTGEVITEDKELYVFPATHYVAGPERMERAIKGIELELDDQLATFERQGKLLEAQRLRMRTTYDVEMMRQVGSCSGIENYSMHMDGRTRGSAPNCLLDYFPEDYLVVIDESHVAVPQIGGMYEGDMSRKRNLVDHGFRLPSAMDNRPLRWEEFLERIGQTIYLSATPGNYELDKVTGADGRPDTVEQIIRPTGLIDPEVVIKPTKGQIDDLIHEIRTRAEKDERVLVTTLTKKMSEDLTDYLLDAGIRTRYLHSEVDTLRRIELLRELRMGEYDVLVGINLLREGLDLPEVSLVAILDADKEGFLRSDKSLIQTIGRAARNVSGQVHMYADKITPSMEKAIDETNRRREKQVAYNTRRRGRPPAAAQEDRRHHRDARPRGREHPGAPGDLGRHGCQGSRRRREGAPAGARAVQGGRRTARRRHRRHAELRPGPADPGAHRPDEGRGRRAAVRGRGPDARRDLRPEEGAQADDGGDQVRRQADPGHLRLRRSSRALALLVRGPRLRVPPTAAGLRVLGRLLGVAPARAAQHAPRPPIDPTGAGPRLFFQQVPEGKAAKNRLHLDVRAAPGLEGEERMAALEAECERLVALGATRVERHEPAPPMSGGHHRDAGPRGQRVLPRLSASGRQGRMPPRTSAVVWSTHSSVRPSGPRTSIATSAAPMTTSITVTASTPARISPASAAVRT